MAAESETLRLIIQARDAASPAVRRASRAFTTLDRSVKRLPRLFLNFKTAIAGLGTAYLGQRLVRGVLDTASGFERLQISLDTITKGEGDKYFKELNEWALKMPVNTEKAIDAFRSMRAMGLDPTIEDMTILVDTMGALGGSEATMESIARALGQIQTKGKVSAEELLQLAEQGIPAYEILADKLNLTKDQLENIGNEGLDASKAVRALLEGMAERFGGQSEKMQNTFSGLMESLKSYWKEFQRLMMEEGAFEGIKNALRSIVDRIDELRASGEFQAWAREAGRVAVNAVAAVIESVGMIPRVFHNVRKAAHNTAAFFEAMAARMVDASAAMMFSMDMLLNPARAGKAIAKGPREAYPALAEMRDAIDEAGVSLAGMAIEADQSAKEASRLASKARNMANAIRDIPNRPVSEVRDSIREAVDAIFATENALDAFEKKARAAYGEAQKQVTEYGKKVREIEEEIASYKMGIEDRIRALHQKAMSDEEAWLDQRRQAEEKLAAAQKARAEGNAELAEELAKQAISLSEDLAREVTRTSEGGEQSVVRTLQDTTVVAEQMIRKAAGFVIDMKNQQRSAFQEMLDQAKRTAEGIRTELDELAKKREAEILIQVPELERMERRFAELTRDEVKTITVRTVEARRAGGLAGFASGGRIPGWGGGDRIRALLERGEFVIRKEAVRRYGQGLFHALNNLSFPTPQLPKFAMGGAVAGGSSGLRNLGKVEIVAGGQSFPVIADEHVAEGLKRILRKEKLMKGN